MIKNNVRHKWAIKYEKQRKLDWKPRTRIKYFKTVISIAYVPETHSHTLVKMPDGMTEAAFIKSITDLVRQCIPGVTDDIIVNMKPDMSVLVQDYTQRMAKVEEDLKQEKDMIQVRLG